MKSDRRISKIENVLNFRQPDLKIVLENIHDPHNVSAIFRTCDSIGIEEIYLIYSKEKFPRIGKKSSASAYKWVKKKNFISIDECYSSLRKEGFKICVTEISDKSKYLWDTNLSEKIAIVLGNEHRGVSEEASSKADLSIRIPMYGMIQSLNVSVASAVILYEAARQRFISGGYDNLKYSKSQYQTILDEWLKK